MIHITLPCAADVLWAMEEGLRCCAIGAVIGEFIARQKLDEATRVGVGTWIGLLVGTLAKLALAFAMVGIAIAAYLID